MKVLIISLIHKPEKNAEGTVIYDSTEKCIRFYNGTEWSSCIPAKENPIDNNIIISCNETEFTGEYIRNVALVTTGTSRATFKVHITNRNKFTPITIVANANDLKLDNGVTVTGVLASTIVINPLQSASITYYLSGTPASDEINYQWNLIDFACAGKFELTKRVIRIGYSGDYSVGGTQGTNFRSQLNNKSYYGPEGIYSEKNISSFSIISAITDINNLTAAQLLEKYDMINVSATTYSEAIMTKLIEYADLGGVLWASTQTGATTTGGNHTNSINIHKAFGGTGTISNKWDSAPILSNSDSINNGVFGDARNITFKGFNATTVVTDTQIPLGARVIGNVSTDPNRVAVYILRDRIVWYYESDMFSNLISLSGAIDNDQERFVHNLFAYMLDQIQD
ncbi:hypothetical protein K5I29_11490 [Flavobacterium agricola]|uniref:Uncharacterized protein n=1 Tax=Flavobacterium agricola TaxID=2870839 RepID=A0ABY6M0Z9_9FLAO|nr:hypothetical protein [Flavobacterium agricola]UYW01090.1 hypothetical protein K5I29_11490 [Flavobacterium agricola]